MKDFSLIVAVDNEFGIGKDNELVWDIPEDRKYFKKITSTTQDPKKQNAVLMGRKTWESIPEVFRPFPNRYNAVLSRSYDDYGSQKSGAFRFKTITGALKHISDLQNIENIFIVGGAQIYNTLLSHPCLKKIYLTQIYNKYYCDTFLESIPLHFELISKSEIQEHNGVEYEFLIYERKQSFWFKIKKLFSF